METEPLTHMLFEAAMGTQPMYAVSIPVNHGSFMFCAQVGDKYVPISKSVSPSVAVEAPREGAEGAPVVVLGAGVVVVVVVVVVLVLVVGAGVVGLVCVVGFLVVGRVVEGGGSVKSTSQLYLKIFNI